MKTLLASILIPCLLQSYEDSAKKLAEDFAAAETPSGKVGVGDEYVKLLKKFPKKRQEIVDAASDCYAKAWPDLDPFWKTKTREHLAKLYAPPVPGKSSFPEGWSGPVDGTHKIALSSERVHSGGGAVKLTPGAKARNARLLYTPTLKGAGKKIEISLWILTDGTNSIDDEVRFYLDGSVSAKKLTKDTPIWTRITFDANTVGGSFDRINLELVLFSKEGVAYVDDISVKVDGKELLPSGGFEGAK